MSDADIGRQIRAFDDVEQVVGDVLRFKRKLGIGEDAYWTSRYSKKLTQLWDVGGIAMSGAGLAGSSTVATTFFGGSGLLSAIGLGGAAVTPVGWVVTAAVASGAAYYGVTSVFRSYFADQVDTIPKFINTPIDLLGASLFDLMVPLAIKLARIDSAYVREERDAILDYFVKDWGFDPDYAEPALELIEVNTTDQALNELVTALSDFKAKNPDCNYDHMTDELVGFLKEIALADGIFDEREEMAIERVEKVLKSRGKLSFAGLIDKLPTWRKAAPE